jgi:hypothetical protein
MALVLLDNASRKIPDTCHKETNAQAFTHDQKGLNRYRYPPIYF